MPGGATPQPIYGFYKDPQEALRGLGDGFNYWTGKLTESSFALSLAIIAANWAVFGSLDRLLNNLWAEISISAVICSLVVSLFGNWILGGMLRRRIAYAEADPENWAREFKGAQGKSTPWPSTAGIDGRAAFLRFLKTWLPIAGGACFLVALFFSRPVDTASKRETDRENSNSSPVRSSLPVASQPPSRPVATPFPSVPTPE
jgi:hypothetical protein